MDELKFMIETILQDLCIAKPNWNIISLRYFNPVGAHKSGLIGDNPNNIPDSLMPYILRVATNMIHGSQRSVYDILNIFGR